MSIAYHREKLGIAVIRLARGNKPLRERLLSAFESINSLMLADLLVELPDSERCRLESIEREASALGPYKASIEALADDRAEHIAEQIVRLYSWTCEHAPLYRTGST